MIYCDISPRGRGLTRGSAGAPVLASLSPAVKDFPQEAVTFPEVSHPLDHKNLSGCIIWGGRVRSRCYVTHPRTLRRGHLRGELSPTIRHSSAAPAFLYDKINSTGPERGKRKTTGLRRAAQTRIIQHVGEKFLRVFCHVSPPTVRSRHRRESVARG